MARRRLRKSTYTTLDGPRPQWQVNPPYSLFFCGPLDPVCWPGGLLVYEANNPYPFVTLSKLYYPQPPTASFSEQVIAYWRERTNCRSGVGGRISNLSLVVQGL